ncbi:MAG: hypothetical protein O7F73_05530 [Gammaproteobacteria bacterium]|nr:hypothetical protein [Gammaproteobacteria bacterium]
MKNLEETIKPVLSYTSKQMLALRVVDADEWILHEPRRDVQCFPAAT